MFYEDIYIDSDYISNKINGLDFISEALSIEKLRGFSKWDICSLFECISLNDQLYTNKTVSNNYLFIEKLLVQSGLKKKSYMLDTSLIDDFDLYFSIPNELFSNNIVHNFKSYKLSNEQILLLQNYWKKVFINDITFSSNCCDNFYNIFELTTK